VALEASDRPTALLCANDLMAIGAIGECKAAGLTVPGDVSIAGFDDVPIAALITPALTTVSQPAREMGYEAATLLLNLLAEGSNGRPHEPFPASLVVRDSVASPVPSR
jgi:DNA-binding LacI/PurR family transcriptional regulator